MLVPTPHGPAELTVQHAATPRAALLLGHGAGGGVGAPDLIAAAGVAVVHDVTVVLVTQPYRVAGRRAPAPAAQLDTAWLTVAAHVRELLSPAPDLPAAESASAATGGPPSPDAPALSPRRPSSLPVLFGGRSSGARVACRTAEAGGASGVLCLAFPLHPPRRPDRTRLPELAGVDVPVLVVQGERDTFGVPDPAPGRDVVLLRGDHALRSDLPALRAAVSTWLTRILPA